MTSKIFESVEYLSLIGITLFSYVTYYYSKYFNCINPLPRVIVLCRAEQVEKGLSATRNPFIMRKSGSNIHLMGKGLTFNHDHKSWKNNPHFFTQAILSPKFIHEATYLANKLSDELESYWKKLYFEENDKKITDFSIWSKQFTNDVKRSYTMAKYFNELNNHEKTERPPLLIAENVIFVHAIHKLILGTLLFQIVAHIENIK
ncbi:hypothetical protein RclHR1_01880005 [Rhizophagus clarus]|uniref:Cytochrome P450 n=1 Tax=Rhizophagus clarus TaxID=94130 RepID=A0A2Z6R1L8_9GLOM|nr:hypothetical protein RclHR1_01880005 [Rhizophagus clarus]GES90246.1 cytochrome P450 [Rhizophagus clarus]